MLAANPGVVRSVGLIKLRPTRCKPCRILPYVLLPGKPEGVPAKFHQRAVALCERMGDMDGNILFQEPTSDRALSELEGVETVKPKRAL
ncbi:hypothetical protein K503DRAFT_599353 [Rhizopogon vinicolor AM-OR11-026]|uniref:Uncharacterized protein n=1 Tax=Rhizopogon vinicolor AM-OR11-026 TaxID=1314800 RepID=A0A1B7N6S9_9AGAM|nr:hypothetical protein K503DRAFT_599353 [Rhizopogon vinicolor AM-OR11-026]